MQEVQRQGRDLQGMRDLSRRVVRRAEPAQPAATVAPSAPSSNGGRQITMEELDARIKAEMEHEKEMIQRSLNNR